METRLFTIFAVIAFNFHACFVNGQDRNFLNINQSLLLVNPSFAGSNGGARVQAGLQGSDYGATVFQTAIDAYVPALNGGVALTVTDIRTAQSYSITSIGFIYARHIRLARSLVIIPSLSPSMYYQRQTLWTPPNLPLPFPDFSLITFPQLAAGILVQAGDRLSAGWSCYNIAGLPTVAEKFLDTRQFIMYTGYNLFLRRNGLLQVQLSYRGDVNRFNYFAFGLNAVIARHLLIGASLATSRPGIFSIGFRSRFASLSLCYGRSKYFIFDEIIELNASFNLRKARSQRAVPFENF